MENPYIAPQHQNESKQQITLKPTLLGSLAILLLAFPCVFALAFAYRTTFFASCISAVVISTPIALIGGFMLRRYSSSKRRRMLAVALLPMTAICIGSIFIRQREEKLHDAVERIREVNAAKRQSEQNTINPSEEPRTK